MSKFYVIHHVEFDGTKPWKSKSKVLGIYDNAKDAETAMKEAEKYLDDMEKYYKYHRIDDAYDNRYSLQMEVITLNKKNYEIDDCLLDEDFQKFLKEEEHEN
jgi:hypothetical protein